MLDPDTTLRCGVDNLLVTYDCSYQITGAKNNDIRTLPKAIESNEQGVDSLHYS